MGQAVGAEEAERVVHLQRLLRHAAVAVGGEDRHPLHDGVDLGAAHALERPVPDLLPPPVGPIEPERRRGPPPPGAGGADQLDAVEEVGAHGPEDYGSRPGMMLAFAGPPPLPCGILIGRPANPPA